MIDQHLTDADIETRLSWLLTLPPFDPILIRPTTEIRELRELKVARARLRAIHTRGGDRMTLLRVLGAIGIVLAWLVGIWAVSQRMNTR